MIQVKKVAVLCETTPVWSCVASFEFKTNILVLTNPCPYRLYYATPLPNPVGGPYIRILHDLACAEIWGYLSRSKGQPLRCAYKSFELSDSKMRTCFQCDCPWYDHGCDADARIKDNLLRLTGMMFFLTGIGCAQAVPSEANASPEGQRSRKGDDEPTARNLGQLVVSAYALRATFLRLTGFPQRSLHICWQFACGIGHRIRMVGGIETIWRSPASRLSWTLNRAPASRPSPSITRDYEIACPANRATTTILLPAAMKPNTIQVRVLYLLRSKRVTTCRLITTRGYICWLILVSYELMVLLLTRYTITAGGGVVAKQPLVVPVVWPAVLLTVDDGSHVLGGPQSLGEVDPAQKVSQKVAPERRLEVIMKAQLMASRATRAALALYALTVLSNRSTNYCNLIQVVQFSSPPLITSGSRRVKVLRKSINHAASTCFEKLHNVVFARITMHRSTSTPIVVRRRSIARSQQGGHDGDHALRSTNIVAAAMVKPLFDTAVALRWSSSLEYRIDVVQFPSVLVKLGFSLTMNSVIQEPSVPFT
ncbi:uncharacterized protein MYCFIDRAFT_171844 [Pseudocercospora fijiensis CIRAD86]|uniref:Uncharacterized protein n=1 Tax=Pseudocercospora fijiensis (strain CIRAD86) TaxID=383855 RepID=M2Z8B3_PSEFD|nr:uncharacterized protein MYCFIDRAFT_171844 [Pseudocercospora fijiensis CIRAD86]EME86020.1 hypothetical protein MYCFIDRAFT_171844 [Pseudocercospora fijiensis CIRAD86]